MPKPNILVICSDQHHPAITEYRGHSTVKTPNMDKLAADELKAQGLYEDTYIVYMSDHGESLGEHGLFYKQWSYEGSVGVPLIVKGPEVAIKPVD